MTYPFLNFNGSFIEFWEWIGNLIPHLTGYVIMLGLKLNHVGKRGHWCQKPILGFRLPMWLYIYLCIIQLNIFWLNWCVQDKTTTNKGQR